MGTLKDLVSLARALQQETGMALVDFRHAAFDTYLPAAVAAQGHSLDRVLLAAGTEETAYRTLLGELYPALAARMGSLGEPESGLQAVLETTLAQALTGTVWAYLGSYLARQGVEPSVFFTAVRGRGWVATSFKAYGVSAPAAVEGELEQANGSTDPMAALRAALQILAHREELKEGVAESEDAEGAGDAGEESEPTPEPEPEPVPAPPVRDELDRNPQVISAVSRVMKVYKDLFEVGFELELPYGVLVEGGVLYPQEEKTAYMAVDSIRAIYDLLNGLSGGSLKQAEMREGVALSDLRNVRMNPGANYYPEFQLGNLFGILGEHKVDSWSKLRQHLEPEVRRNIKENFKAGQDIGNIVDSLTNAVVVSEFDPAVSMRLRVNIGIRKLDTKAFTREYEKVRPDIMYGNGELYHVEVTSNGVLEVILVFDQEAFNGRPLFAYEAVETQLKRGRKPSIREMILGQDTSGKIFTTNLDRQAAAVILVGAGPRSGKGVLTQNIVGTVLASDSPLIYFDCKPDIAPVLWELQDKYGVQVAAWDGKIPRNQTVGQGAPAEVVQENRPILTALAYLKGVQLMMAAAVLAAGGQTFGNGNRPFFIFDEVLSLQQDIKAAWGKMSTWIQDKDKSVDPEVKKWVKGIEAWCIEMDASLMSVLNSQLPMSGVSTVWLFQNMSPQAWGKLDIASPGGKFNILSRPVTSTMSVKLMGAATENSIYGLSELKDDKVIATRVLAKGGRHFAYTESQKISDIKTVTVFKPYLVLNGGSLESKSVQELRGNISESSWDRIAPDGVPDERIGFEGFITLMGESAIQNASLGVQYLEEVMQALGLSYPTVSDYLYDASLESFQSVGRMMARASSELETEQEDESGIPFYRPDEVNPNPTYGQPSNREEEEGEQEPEIPDFEPGMGGGYPESEPTPAVPSSNPWDDLGPSEEGPDTESQRKGEEEQVGGEESKPFEPEPYVPPAPQRRPEPSPRPAPQPVPVRSGPPEEINPVVSPNEQTAYSQVYKEPIQLESNPFTTHGTSTNPMVALRALKETSAILMAEIRRVFGDYSRIESVEITGTGLVLNDIAFRPTFEPDVIDGMPFDIQQQVKQGNILELFDFGSLYKFKNLSYLSVDNARIAEGRMRRELGIHPNKTWMALFGKMRSLRELIIAGERITDEQTAQGYDDEGRGGVTFTERIRTALGASERLVNNSRMNAVWSSRPVRVVGKAVGWTLAAKVVLVGASMFGPFGLLFGGLAGVGAYREFKRNR